MRTSPEPCVNFGAVYMFNFCRATRPFVKRKRALPVSSYTFFDGKRYSNYRSLRHLWLLPQLFKMWWIMKKYTRRISRLLAHAGTKSIRELIESDPYLLKLWKTSALSFITKNNLEKFHRVYGDPICGMTLYCRGSDLNAFTYLGVFFPLAATAWEMDLSETTTLLTKNLRENIVLDEVLCVTGNKALGFSVETKQDIYRCRNVVFAAPLPHLRNIYPSLPQPHSFSSVHVFNVIGTPKKTFAGKDVVIFDQDLHEIYLLWKQTDGSYAVYSKIEDAPLEEYFTEYTIRFRHFWDYAITMQDDTIIDQCFAPNMFIATDCNFSLLESSFLSGEFAADCILSREKTAA